MEKITVAQARRPEAIGKEVCLQGWVRTRRDSKGGFSFLELNDGSSLGNVQVLAENKLPNYESEVKKLHIGASVTVHGEVRASPAKGQPTEVLARSIIVHGSADAEKYPLQKKGASYEFLRTIAHLRPRTNTFGAVLRVRDTAARAVHEFFHARGFVQLQAPIITLSDAEGAGAMFALAGSEEFFGREARLTVSGQLEAEIGALALSRVYTFGPTFRAENSNTSRHLAEFWMIEPELAFCELPELADLAEAFLRHVIQRVLDERPDDMAFFDQRIAPGLLDRLRHVADASFERLTYTEAVALLERSGRDFEHPVRWGMDLQSEHERWLAEEKVGRPLVVTDYPKEIKAFYMYLNDDGRTVRALDVLVPGVGEIIGGSQREHRLEPLRRRLVDAGLREDDYWWYLDLRRFGSAPHAGFGLGFERAVQFITGMANIRDVIPFPRVPGYADF
jgi:asparaginyl-tRNA synthetase